MSRLEIEIEERIDFLIVESQNVRYEIEELELTIEEIEREIEELKIERENT